jgi:hypothetical protein
MHTVVGVATHTVSVRMWYVGCLGVAWIQSQSYITTDGQSASLSWCWALIWDPRQIFPLLSLFIFRQLRVY